MSKLVLFDDGVGENRRQVLFEDNHLQELAHKLQQKMRVWWHASIIQIKVCIVPNDHSLTVEPRGLALDLRDRFLPGWEII